MAQFDQLSDLDFEEFVADLVSAVTGLEFRVGTRGRDRGIDALSVDGKRHVIQCKHYRESTFSQLKEAATKEAGRLEGLDEPFASYRFVSSKPLNHDQWEALFEILEPWLGSRENVLGGNDLARLLREKPTVERRHPKLWFSGIGQLRQALSAESYERRNALIEEIRPRAPRYVETRALRRARRLLGKQQVCVVDGPAGVGKTTLAQLLLLECLERGFELFEVVPGSLGKAWELLENDEKQVFYFDDFLGHTGLFEKREHDRDLIRFIRRIAGDAQRRLVLTTRDYILAQARRRSETLNREVDDGLLFHLTVDAYSRTERARIFYNHLYFADEVDAAARASLISSGSHLQVIDHHGYSPLVIEAITGYTGHTLTTEEKADYGHFCVEALSAPDDLWSHPFEQGLGEHEQALVLSFLGLLDRVRLGTLETAFEAACAARGLATTGRQFQHSLSAVLGTFVSRIEGVRGGGPRFSLTNPSLIDYLKSYVRSSQADAEALLRGACLFDQAVWVGQAIFSGRSEPPRESLQLLFGETLARLFESPSQINLPAFLDEDPAWSSLDKRLGHVLPFCRHRWFREATSGWLPQRVQRWLAGFDDGETFNIGELERLLGLLECELVDPAKVCGKVKASIESLEPGYPRELLDALAHLCPETLDAEFVAEERMALGDHVEDVLERPEDFFDFGEDLEEFARLLPSWGLAIGDAELERACDTIEGARAEERKEMEKAGEPEDFGFESWDEFRLKDWHEDEGNEGNRSRGDDGEIEAMFARLLELASASGDA